MNANKKYLHFSISFAIMLAAYVAFRLLYRNQNNPINYGISTWFMTMVLSCMTTGIAGITLLLRIAGRFVNRDSFYYNFTGSANFCLGAVYFVLLFLQKLDDTSLLSFVINLILGTIIITDIFLIEEPNDITNSVDHTIL